MKKQKIIICFVFFFLSVECVFAQSAQQNLQKYWYYRFRLQNDFMLVGEGQGKSLPAHRRFTSDSSGDSLLKWGDATMDLGWYIGVLATEYKLLK